mgnify:FL=1
MRKSDDTNGFDDQPIQSVAKALKILDTFSSDHMEWGIRELSRETGINPTTIFRMVNTLTNAGYLERNPLTQGVTLGPQVMKLAGLYAGQNPLPKVAQKVFEEFADRFEHNFYLGKLSQFRVIYLAVLDGRGPIKITTEAGGVTNLHSTGLGKSILAFQDSNFIHDYFQYTQLDHYTDKTIDSKEELVSQLALVKEQQYAVNSGEQYDDVGAVAVPLIPRTGPVTMAVALAYPQHLITEKRLDLNNLIGLTREIGSEIMARYEPTRWAEYVDVRPFRNL